MAIKKATPANPAKRAGKTPPILRIGSVTLGGKSPLFILGPCVIEGEKPLLRAARTIKSICDDLGAQFIFKASYDKANRTSGSSYRGVGALDGCRMLAEAGAAIGVPVTTDIHSPEEAAMAAGVDGIFLETHENPAKAPSDGPNQIPHRNLRALLHSLLSIHRALA